VNHPPRTSRLPDAANVRGPATETAPFPGHGDSSDGPGSGEPCARAAALGYAPPVHRRLRRRWKAAAFALVLLGALAGAGTRWGAPVWEQAAFLYHQHRLMA